MQDPRRLSAVLRPSTAALLAMAWLTAGCPSPSAAPTGGAPTTDAPDTDVKPAQPKAEKKKPEPMVPPAAPVPVQSVAIVGYGLKIDVHPPFQAAYMGVYVEDGNSEGLIVSWWDVTHPAAGRTGHAGLYNLGVAVHDNPPDAPIVQTTLSWPDGRTGTAYRRGETGSFVLLPPELLEMGGVGQVSVGPEDQAWSIEVDGERTPFNKETMLHSHDPATGSLFSIERDPRKPWGPWPEAPPPKPATEPTTP